MARTFTVSVASEWDGVTTLKIDFGEPAQNTDIVPDAIAAVKELELAGGRGIHIDGRASLPVAMALAHCVAHLFGYVACFDPKLEGFVVAISHDPKFMPGQLIATTRSTA